MAAEEANKILKDLESAKAELAKIKQQYRLSKDSLEAKIYSLEKQVELCLKFDRQIQLLSWNEGKELKQGFFSAVEAAKLLISCWDDREFESKTGKKNFQLQNRSVL